MYKGSISFISTILSVLADYSRKYESSIGSESNDAQHLVESSDCSSSEFLRSSEQDSMPRCSFRRRRNHKSKKVRFARRDECSFSSDDQFVSTRLAREPRAYNNYLSIHKKIENILPCFELIKPFLTFQVDMTNTFYQAFNGVGTFLDNICIESAQEIFLNRLEARQNDSLQRVISYGDYDALNTYYYDCEANNALPFRKFDVQFMMWFCNRFQYYVSRASSDINAAHDFNITFDAITKSYFLKGVAIDLLSIPKEYVNDYSDSEKLTQQFNNIITDTDIACYVTKFVEALIYQVRAAYARQETNGAYNTLDNYSELLNAILLATNELSEINQQIKLDYFGTNMDGGKSTFVAFPVGLRNTNNNAITYSTFYATLGNGAINDQALYLSC